MSIAIRFDNGTVIVSNEYSFEITHVSNDGKFAEQQLIDVVAPFIVEGNAPVQGDECLALTDDRKVYKCSMYNKVYTEAKLRLHRHEEIEFKQQDWKTIK